MSREAEDWAYRQTWCSGSVKFALVVLCRRARAWTYRGPLQQIATDTGMSMRSVQHAITIFREVQRVASPKRGIYEITPPPEDLELAQRVASLELEILEMTPGEEIDSKENPFPSPTPPSISKEIVIGLTGAREGQSTFLEIPEWAEVINSTADFCGGEHLKPAHFPKLIEKALDLDLLDEAHKFDSWHRTEYRKKAYKKFATYLRFSSTWIPRALEQRNDGKTGKSGKHLVSNREGRDGAFADPSRYHD